MPVLIDLGVAAKEAEMIVAGTPLYFAPEIAAQYAGKAERPPVNAKADVFSLALSREVVLGVIGTVTLSHATIDDNECFGWLKVCGTRVVGTLSRPF